MKQHNGLLRCCALAFVLLAMPVVAAAAISGTVYRDINFSGGKGATEPGVAGVTVTVYDTDGSVIDSTTTADDGSYSLATSGSTFTPRYRVEFTNIPTHLGYGPWNAGISGTAVAFVTNGRSDVHLGLVNPGDYCDGSPEVCGTLMPRSFSYNAPGVGVIDASDDGDTAVFSYDYSINDMTGGTTSDTALTMLATAGDVGPLFGLAFQKGSQSIFGAAYLRRGSGFGSDGQFGPADGGIGSVYRIPVGGASTKFIEFTDSQYAAAGIEVYDTGTPPHSGSSEGWDIDGNAYTQVGKVGIGDIDLSDDELTLYAMNLYQREVLVLPLKSAENPVAPTASEIARVAVPIPSDCDYADPALGPTSEDVRPFGLEFHDGKLYVGMVCTAQSFLDANGGATLTHDDPLFIQARGFLQAYVYEMDPATNTFSSSPALQFPLDYPREYVNSTFTDTDNDGEWFPWNDYWVPSFSPTEVVYGNFQPMLTDIAFDSNGLMVLGLRDRYSDMAFDEDDPGPSGGDSQDIRAAGDLLLACDVDGTWALESEGVCDGRVNAEHPNEADDAGPGTAGNYHEFFYDETGASGAHEETALGSLALLPGEEEVVTTRITALSARENGAAVFNTADGGGDVLRKLRFFQPYHYYAKGGGTGDIELICDAAPIEVGNRVWNDANGNGIQDTGEDGLNNVTVELWYDSDGDGDFSDESGAIATTSTGLTTNFLGHYLFTSDSRTIFSGRGGVTGIADLRPGRLYQVRVDLSSSGLPAGSVVTRKNYANQVGTTDLHDSDGDRGELVPGYSTVEFFTGPAGDNRHHFDFGITQPAGLGDFVWYDDGAGGGVAADGIQNGTESGVPGVTVTLYDVGADGLKGTGDDFVAGTETTDASGYYFFADLAPGTYYAGFSDLPSGYLFSTQNASSGSEATDSDADVITGLTDVVTLAAGETNMDVDAGINNTTAVLGDYVWADSDRDGIQDANESGIWGVNLSLYQDANGNGVYDEGVDTWLASTVTDASGLYLFTGLDPNEGGAAYFVVVDDADLNTGDGSYLNGGDGKDGTVLDHWFDTPNHVDGAHENNTNATGATYLSAGEVNLLSDFGYYPDQRSGFAYSILDTVWLDPDEDGDGDDGGPGFESAESDTAFEGVTVQLLRDPDGTPGTGDEVVLATDTSDSSGEVYFDDLQAGDYILAVEDAAGVLTGYDGTDTHSLAGYRSVSIVTTNVSNQSFPYHAEFGTIGDTVWLDNGDGGGTAGDGVQNGSEGGIGGVTVRLYRDIDHDGVYDAGSDVTVATQTTDTDGYYLFEQLPLGFTYTVEVTDTAGVLSGLVYTGDPDGTLDGVSATTVSSAAPIDLDQDFGLDVDASATLGSIAGIVFRDRHLDGATDWDTITADVDEQNIDMNGVTVTLYRSTGSGSDGIAGTGDDDWAAIYTTETTSGTGSTVGVYAFTDLPLGEYYYVDVEEDTVLSIYPTNTTDNDPVDGAAPADGHVIHLDAAGSGTDVDGTTSAEDDHARVNFGFSDDFVNPAWLAWFEAAPGPNAGDVSVNWATTQEFGNIGFMIYAFDGEEWVNAGGGLVRTRVVTGDGAEEVVYRVDLSGVAGSYFALIDVDAGLELGVHGPFRLGLRYGSSAEAAGDRRSSGGAGSSTIERERRLRERLERTLENYQSGRAPADSVGGASREDLAMRGRDGAGFSAMPKPGLWQSAVAAVFGALVAPAHAEDLAYLEVDEPGVYRLYDDSLGTRRPLSRRAMQRLTVTHRGEPVPVRTGREGSGRDARSYIEFIGDGFESLYTDTNTYVLGIGRGGDGMRMRSEGGKAPRRASAPDHYLHTVKVEPQNRYNIASPADNDPYYADYVLSFSGSPQSSTMEFEIEHLVDGAAAPVVSSTVWPLANTPEDHQAELSVEGAGGGTHSFSDIAFFSGYDEHMLTGTLPDGVLADGTNTARLTLPADHGVWYDLLYWDAIEVTYPRAFEAIDGRLHFRADATVFEAGGLPDEEVSVYRRDADGAVYFLENVDSDNGTTDDEWTVRFRGASGEAEYFVVAEGHHLVPRIELLPPAEDIERGRAEYLIIAPEAFIDNPDLQTLATLRSGRYDVRRVALEQIIRRYGHGVYGVEPVKAYLRHAFEHMGLRMVLLVGDDTRDYLGTEVDGSSETSFIPTPYAATGNDVTYAAVDNWYVDFDDDDLADVPIGRLTVQDDEDLTNVVAKILAYEGATYRNVVLVSDVADSSTGYVFRDASVAFGAALPATVDAFTGVHLDDTDIPDANLELVAAIESGAALISYHGHSGYLAWGSNWTSSAEEKLFDDDDAAALANVGMPAVVAQWGCWTTDFVNAKTDVLSNTLLNESQGAVAVLGSPALTDAIAWGDLSNHFAAALEGRTLGEAMVHARKAFAASLSQTRAETLRPVLLGWSLLGDPALTATVSAQ